MQFTHTLIDDVVLVLTENNTSVKVHLHDNGELDFDGHEVLSDDEFDEMVEYVTAEFPGPDDE